MSHFYPYAFQIPGVTKATYTQQPPSVSLVFSNQELLNAFYGKMQGFLNASRHPALSGTIATRLRCRIEANPHVPEEWKIRSVVQIIHFLAGEFQSKDVIIPLQLEEKR